MRVVFSDSAYNAVVSEATERIGVETGGVFLGRYENEIWYVIESIEPGPKAIFQESYFEYDQQYVECRINKAAEKYPADLTFIGNWHKHLGSLYEFTPTDDGTNYEHAKMSDEGIIAMLINTAPSFRITPYHVSLPLKYTKIDYQVGDELIPEHLLIVSYDVY